MRERFTAAAKADPKPTDPPDNSNNSNTTVFVFTILFIILFGLNLVFAVWIAFYRLYYGPHANYTPYLLLLGIGIILLFGAFAAPILISTNIVTSSINYLSDGSLKSFLMKTHNAFNYFGSFGSNG